MSEAKALRRMSAAVSAKGLENGSEAAAGGVHRAAPGVRTTQGRIESRPAPSEKFPGSPEVGRPFPRLYGIVDIRGMRSAEDIMADWVRSTGLLDLHLDDIRAVQRDAGDDASVVLTALAPQLGRLALPAEALAAWNRFNLARQSLAPVVR